MKCMWKFRTVPTYYELREVRLISFIGEGPSYDDAELEAAIAKGTEAWANVPDSVVWLRNVSNRPCHQLRGVTISTFLITAS